MDAALVINGVVDTIARDIAKLSDMLPVTGGTWVKATSDAVFAGFLYDGSKFTAPSLPDPPAAPAVIYKADIFRRATEDEAEAMTAALSQASARLQGIFAGAQMLSTDDPDFPMIRAGIIAAVGETRADQLLAPSI